MKSPCFLVHARPEGWISSSLTCLFRDTSSMSSWRRSVLAAEALQDIATTSSWVRYMPFGGRQRERWWCRCCKVWFSRRPKASLAPGVIGSVWFCLGKRNYDLEIQQYIWVNCSTIHLKMERVAAALTTVSNLCGNISSHVGTCLFLGFLVGIVVTVVGFDWIGLLHLLVTVGRNIQPLHNTKLFHVFNLDISMWLF